MILYLNGSPKTKVSASEYFLKQLNKSCKSVYLYKTNFELIDFDSYDTIILSCPLYVDSPPSRVIELMEYIDSCNVDITNKKIYVILNCGFLSSKNNYLAIMILKNFFDKHGAKFNGAMSIGAGSIHGNCETKKYYKIMCAWTFRKIKKFKKAIINNEIIYLASTIHPMTKWLYIFLANISWYKKCKRNGI